MYFNVQGTGEPLILLHGGFGCSDVWVNQVPIFSQQYLVITPDSRAHGRTTDSDAPLTYHLMAEGIIRLMDHLDIKSPYIVGWSDGGILDWSLRNDPRVILHEKTNIRHLEPDRIPELIDLVVIDVSFISLTQVLPRVPDFLGPEGDVLALIKPQFEVGKGMVDKGGVIRDEMKRRSAVQKVSYF